jgi:protein gp37
MLGAVDLKLMQGHENAWRAIGLDWVICGGESGHGARPMHPDWARSLRDQCDAVGVPFFFKQWGEWVDADNGSDDYGDYQSKRQGWVQTNGGFREDVLGFNNFGDYPIFRIGKKAAGRELDGMEHDGVPS